MIIKPIIPIWLMGIVCVIFLIFKRKGIFNYIRQIIIVILLFVINLRIMIPSKNQASVDNNVDVLFVVDNTISILAEDYNGDERRIDAIKEDCAYVMEELPGASFSVVSFGNNVQRMAPYTTDSSIAIEAIKSLNGQTELYAKGTSLNDVMESLEDTLDNTRDTYQVVFFISDGEITSEGESLKSFPNLEKYVDNGAVLGYGTKEGGYMKVMPYAGGDEEYLEYYDDGYKKARSKIDEENLKKIASDFGIDYVHMEKKSDIDSTISKIQNDMKNGTYETRQDSTKGATDIYYFFLIPLVGLLIFDYIYYKRKL